MTEYIEREALMRYPIRRDHYDRKNGNEHFINGIESVLEYAESLPAADVAPVRHGRCPVCNGKVPIVQDCDKWYSIEIEGREMSVWDGNKCVAIFSIEYCPNCGAKMDLEAQHE